MCTFLEGITDRRIPRGSSAVVWLAQWVTDLFLHLRRILTPQNSCSLRSCVSSRHSWFLLKTQQRHYDKWTSRDAGSFCACDSLEATCKREKLRLINRGISKPKHQEMFIRWGQLKECIFQLRKALPLKVCASLCHRSSLKDKDVPVLHVNPQRRGQMCWPAK